MTREIENLRAIITELRPAALDELGLSPALEALARRMEATEGLEVLTAIRPASSGSRLAPDLETTVYRVAQEALTNAAKHARATRVVLRLSDEDGLLRLEVIDDGVGIRDDAADQGGFGLVGMRERVELAGGRLWVQPGRPGTRVLAELPLRLA